MVDQQLMRTKVEYVLNGFIFHFAYKPDVDDMRESPTFKIFDLLKAKGAEIAYYDPYIPEICETREHAEYTGMKTVEWNKKMISGYDAVLISTNHSSIDYSELAEWSDCIIDTRNAMNGVESKKENHIFKA
jgi:UDP-N-acetyl-D-glucosamine dehydrogenase